LIFHKLVNCCFKLRILISFRKSGNNFVDDKTDFTDHGIGFIGLRIEFIDHGFISKLCDDFSDD